MDLTPENGFRVVCKGAIDWQRPGAMPRTTPFLPQDRICFIYFLENKRSGLVKIGRTRNVLARVCALRKREGEPVQLLGAFRAPARMEQELHQEFSQSRLHIIEWFRPSDRLTARIAELCTDTEGCLFHLDQEP